MTHRQALPLICVALCAAAFAAPHQRTVVWDFEDGTDGWWANPWSGGKARVEHLVEGKYGKGLAGFWENVPGGGNVVSPFLDELPGWEPGDWRIISFWLKGDGTRGHTTLQVHSRVADGRELGYSASVPLDSTHWRRFSLNIGTFWNREGVAYNPLGLRRILFTGTGTRQFAIDHVCLETLTVPVPTEQAGREGAWELGPEIARSREALLTTLVPGPLAAPATVRVSLKCGGLPEATAESAVACPPTDDVVLATPIPEGARGRCELTVSVGSNGQVMLRSAHSFDLVSAQEPVPVLTLLPSPKQARLAPAGVFPLPATLQLRGLGDQAQIESLREYLMSELQSRWQIPCEYEPGEAPAGRFLLTASADGLVQSGDVPWETLAARGPEAYFLRCTEQGVVIAGTDRRGLRHGAMSLLQMVGATVCVGPREIPGVEITDWPDLPIRGITIPLPTDRWGYPNDAPVDPEFWKRYLLRTCLEHRLNTVVILVRQGMKYARHPEIDGPAAWEQDTLRDIVATLKAHDINPIPLLDSLGHANWLVIPIARLREDGDTNTLCTRHPEAKQILLDCYEEVIDVFRPTHFHMGLDEIRWQTFNKPEDQRCPICRGVDKREIFVEQVTMLHEFLTARGITPMMWGDMVLEKHGGGAPFYLDQTLERLPKDIVITNWSITLDPLSNQLFRRLGFPVIQSNSEGVTPVQAPDVQGNFFGVWSKLPWMTENAVGPGEAEGYSHPAILAAVEYGWNLYPDPLVVGVPVTRSFYMEHDSARLTAMCRFAWEAPVGGMTPVTEGDPVSGLCGAARFSVAAEPQAVLPDQPLIVPVGRKTPAVYVLAAVDIPQDQSEAFYKRLRAKDSWRGVPVAELALVYEDGTEQVRPLMFGYDLRDGLSPGLPYVYGAADYWQDRNGRLWYAVQWPNPHPERVVKEVRLGDAGSEARALVQGVSVGDD